VAGIYSPAVVVFKDDLDHHCVDLPIEDQVVVSVITVAAPCQPVLTPDGLALQYDQDIRDFKAKIRLVLRIAARNGHDMLVLGGFLSCLTLPAGLTHFRCNGLWSIRLSSSVCSKYDEEHSVRKGV
jgi:hypothetical protein